MGDNAIRVSDAERDSAATALWTHFETGRLTPAEHEERCARAAAARTRAELEELFDDLPTPHPELDEAVSANPDDEPTDELAPLTRSVGLALLGGVVLVAGLTAAIIFTVLHGMWWLFFLVVGVSFWLFVLSDQAEQAEKRERKAEQDT